MSQTQSSSTNTVHDKLGLAIGLLVAIIWFMPLHSYTYPYFTKQVLNYIPWGSEFIFSLIWMACLFFFIVSMVRFAVSAFITMVATFFSMLAVKFTLWRSARRYK